MVGEPIWRDYFAILTPQASYSGDSLEYKIFCDGKEIYRGKVYKFNGVFRVKLNDVCSNYLYSSIIFSTGWEENSSAMKTFTTYYSTNGFSSQVLANTVTFYCDYSYTINNTNVFSKPIKKEIDYRQFFVYTIYGSGSVSVNGRGYNVATNNIHTFKSKLVDENRKEMTITVPNNTFTTKDTCNRYCLYYLNSYGGWDWILLNGNVIKSYGYNRKNYVSEDYNANPTNTTNIPFGKINYITNTTESWKLTVTNLSDYQSSEMYNLFGSTQVYLHDMVDNIITPVVITSSKQDEKTFYNQGRRMFNYTIEVESSVNKVRK